MTKTYYVGIGGSPKDSWTQCEDFSTALDAAWEIAEELCEDRSQDPDSLLSWGDDDLDIGAGVCPDGQSGYRWPQVFIQES
jgi:hypothetical protein